MSVFKKHKACLFIVVLLQLSIVYSQKFENISDSINIELDYSSTDLWGSGVSFYDYNNDGFDDITFIKENDSIHFYESVNGTLQNSTSFIYGEGEVKSVLWVDYDNDGFLDLFITEKDGPYRLFKNDGNYNFSDVSAQAGLDFSNSQTMGASFADINNNGFLDLYVAKYEFGFTEQDTDKLNQLYKNNGDGTFTNITSSAGIGDSIRTSFQGVWLDYDLDGFVDLYVINDREVFENTLYRNTGNETFVDVTAAAGLEMSSQDPMSTTVGDFDNDGDLDIYITNTGNINPARLYVNNGDGTFTNQAVPLNVDLDKWSWSAVWIDYNNNSWKDLFVATGIPNLASTQVNNYFYINQSGQNFTHNTSTFLNDQAALSTGAARGDFNNDGYYDLIVQNNLPNQSFIWQNTGGTNNYIKITPNGTVSNKFAIGTWIKVYAGGNIYTEYTFCGENYLSQNSQHQIFGLGSINQVDSVEVLYTSGHKDTYYNLSVNEHHFLYEGETLKANVYTNDTVACQGDTLFAYSDNYSNISWYNGELTDSISVDTTSNVFYSGTCPHGVQVYSDTIAFHFTESPYLSAQTSNPTCYGASDGAIQVEFYHDTSQLNPQITWDNDSIGSYLPSLTGGEYTAYYNDLAGCVDSLNIYLQTPPQLSNNFITTNETLGNDGEIDVITFGGVPPYEYQLNNSLAIPPFENLSNGIYNIIVTDYNNCSVTDTVTINSSLNTINTTNETNTISIYPNPVVSGKKIIIKTTLDNIDNFKIKDIEGKIVYESKISIDPIQIKQNSGMYFIEFYDKNNRITNIKKFIVN